MMPSKLKAYMVHNGEESEKAALVFANNAQEARKIGYGYKDIPDDIKFSDEEKSLLVSIGSSSEDAFMAIFGVIASNISDVRKMHAKLRSEFIDPIKIALAEIESAKREGLSMEEAEARAFKKLNAEKISPFMRAAFATDTIQ
jgi:hypothetical protein